MKKLIILLTIILMAMISGAWAEYEPCNQPGCDSKDGDFTFNDDLTVGGDLDVPSGDVAIGGSSDSAIALTVDSKQEWTDADITQPSDVMSADAYGRAEHNHATLGGFNLWGYGSVGQTKLSLRSVAEQNSDGLQAVNTPTNGDGAPYAFSTTYTGCTTTSGSGSGAILSVETDSAGNVNIATVTTEGDDYAIGDTVTLDNWTTCASPETGTSPTFLVSDTGAIDAVAMSNIEAFIYTVDGDGSASPGHVLKHNDKQIIASINNGHDKKVIVLAEGSMGIGDDYVPTEALDVDGNIQTTEYTQWNGTDQITATEGAGVTVVNSGQITGLSDTSDFVEGRWVTISDGFSSTTTSYKITNIGASTITVGVTAIESTTGVTVTQGIGSTPVKRRGFATTCGTLAEDCIVFPTPTTSATIECSHGTNNDKVCGWSINANANRIVEYADSGGRDGHSVQVISDTIPTTTTMTTYVIVPEGNANATMNIGRVSAIYFSGSTALAAHDTNYITWTVTNLGQGGVGSTAILAVDDANTTKATGGSAIVINGKKTLTLHGTAANLQLVAGDRLEITATMNGTLANTVIFPTYAIVYDTGLCSTTKDDTNMLVLYDTVTGSWANNAAIQNNYASEETVKCVITGDF